MVILWRRRWQRRRLRIPLFAEEMFLPIAMLCRVRDRDEAVRLANDSPLGLTAGCYGNDEDAAYFLEHIETGVTYVNRPQGATTGAWPGYQPFGGWKGSGSSGKAIASSITWRNTCASNHRP